MNKHLLSVIAGGQRRSAVVVGDPFLSNVVLLLKGEGVVGATGPSAFYDSAQYHLVPTSTTPTNTITDADKKFGNSSIQATDVNVGLGYNEAVLAPRLEDFTIECWVKTDNIESGAVIVEVGRFVGFNLYIDHNFSERGRLALVTPTETIHSADIVPIDVFNHIAVERFNGTLSAYVNGVAIGSIEYSLDMDDEFNFACMRKNQSGFNAAYFDEFRYTIGVARYKGNFQPPTSEFPVPAPPVVSLPDGVPEDTTPLLLDSWHFTFGEPETAIQTEDALTVFTPIDDQGVGISTYNGTPAELIAELGFTPTELWIQYTYSPHEGEVGDELDGGTTIFPEGFTVTYQFEPVIGTLLGSGLLEDSGSVAKLVLKPDWETSGNPVLFMVRANRPTLIQGQTLNITFIGYR